MSLIYYFDIDDSKLLDINYENKNIKFRTMTKGNLFKIKDIIDTIKLNNNYDFVKIPESDVNNNPIIIKKINQITYDNKKINIKEKIEEYIEYDHTINLLDIIDKNTENIELDYFVKYKPKNKIIKINELADFKITDLYKLFS